MQTCIWLNPLYWWGGAVAASCQIGGIGYPRTVYGNPRNIPRTILKHPKTPDYKHWQTWDQLRTTWDNLGHLVVVLNMYDYLSSVTLLWPPHSVCTILITKFFIRSHVHLPEVWPVQEREYLHQNRPCALSLVSPHLGGRERGRAALIIHSILPIILFKYFCHLTLLCFLLFTTKTHYFNWY